MFNRFYFRVVLGLIMTSTIQPAVYAQSEYMRIHSEALVADLHNDAIYRHHQGQNIESFSSFTQFDLVKMRQGGIDVQFFALWPDPEDKTRISMFDQTRTRMDSLLVIIERNPEIIQLAKTPEMIRQIIRSGKTAACLGVEGGTALENDLQKLDYFFDRGVRYLGLTWNDSPDWASSAKDETSQNWKGQKGLSEFGVKVIKRMNMLGMMIDVSHAGEKTFYDAITYSEKPVIASHSSVYALCPHYRNLKDDQIKALAAKGGVVFVNFYPGYLVKDFDSIYMNSRKQADIIEDSLRNIGGSDTFNRAEYIHGKIEKLYPGVSVLVDHIEYVINLVGDNHVGLGSDFSGISIPPAGLENVSRFPRITKEMVTRGYSETTIKKILGENLMRVFNENLKQ